MRANGQFCDALIILCFSAITPPLLKRALTRLIHNPPLQKDVHKKDRQQRQNGGRQNQPLIAGVLGLVPDEQLGNGAVFGRFSKYI